MEACKSGEGGIGEIRARVSGKEEEDACLNAIPRILWR